MPAFRDLSIRYKLTLLLLAVVSVVVLAVSVANVIDAVHTTRAALAGKYTTLAKIVAAESGAALSIADVDPSGAHQILSDLRVEPSIHFAALYNAHGAEVARYATESLSDAALRPPQLPGAAFTDGRYFDVVENVTLSDGPVIGRVFIRATTHVLKSQIRRIVVIAAVVYLAALALAFLLSFVLQRFISAPILELAALTQRISTQHDYSLSANYRGNGELGALCHGFNAMLAEIRCRDDELERSNEELQRSNDELKQFAFVASHDLQEPLRSITSFCNLLEDEYRGRLDEQADDYIDRIVNGSKRMKALVNDLLSYSRVTREVQAEFRPVDLREVVEAAVENLQTAIHEADAEINAGPLPVVAGDRTQLVQLMQNLIGNAIKYRGERPPQVRIEAVRRGAAWECSVRDNGIGIAPEFHQQIFEIFKRLHGRDKYPGTGIGLAVCKKIVQRHGGQIFVDSQAGHGSVFRFTIQSPTEVSIHEDELLTASV
jgi:signal transduction histidine kinase